MFDIHVRHVDIQVLTGCRLMRLKNRNVLSLGVTRIFLTGRSTFRPAPSAKRQLYGGTEKSMTRKSRANLLRVTVLK